MPFSKGAQQQSTSTRSFVRQPTPRNTRLSAVFPVVGITTASSGWSTAAATAFPPGTALAAVFCSGSGSTCRRWPPNGSTSARGFGGAASPSGETVLLLLPVPTFPRRGRRRVLAFRRRHIYCRCGQAIEGGMEAMEATWWCPPPEFNSSTAQRTSRRLRDETTIYSTKTHSTAQAERAEREIQLENIFTS